MSHLKERKEKNCLNCNAQIYGTYCNVCGQENIEPQESAWHLISHFFQDITHFDGKFFNSIKLLITRPGYLSRAYMVGRRASYLNPVRLYVFTSALFFLIFFSLYQFDAANVITIKGDVNKIPVGDIAAMDSARYKFFVDVLVKNDSTLKFAYNKKQYLKYLDSIALASAFTMTPSKYKSKKAYDSALANGKDHNWIERKLVYKQIDINEKYGGNRKAAMIAVINSLLHYIPQILFITLPLFALLLKLLYVRQKKYYYVNHAIFAIHLFVFVFITLLAIFGINKIEVATGAHWLSYLSSFLILLVFFYNYKSMRNFYQQGRAKTLLKLFLLNLANLFIAIILFTAFIFLSLFKL